MVHERTSAPAPKVGAADTEFTAAFALYLGLAVAGLTSIAGFLANASTAVVLVTAPGTVTAVLVLVLLVGDRLRGLPERLGRTRGRRLACYAPAAAFAALAALPAVTPIEHSARLAVVTIVFAAITAIVGVGIAQMARTRYVYAITGDEPAAAWTWQPTGYGAGNWITTGGLAATVVVGLLIAVFTRSFHGLFMALYGITILLLTTVGRKKGWADEPAHSSEMRAYAAGLVFQRGLGTRLVPWDDIAAIRLTDDELVLERRRWFDVRCDRSAIDEPESVLEGIELARSGGVEAADEEFATR